MSEGTDDLVLEHLRHIRHQVDALHEDMGELKLRMTSLEGHLVSVIITETRHSNELDRLRTRVELIERRLVIAES